MDNPDSDGIVFTSIAGANILEVSDAGINVKEIPTKTCYDIVKFIKVKEFNFKSKEKKQVGFIAQDILSSKIASSEWSNFVSQGKDGVFRMDYSQMGVISWGAIQF